MKRKQIKRYGKAGRFNRPDFADLGLSAYKNQQDQQIGNLRELQRRQDEYASAYATDLRSIGVQEEQNAKLLQNLEDKAFQTRRDAIKVKGQREVENIRSQADDAGREAKMWAELSPKLAKAFTNLGTGLAKRADKIQSDNLYQETLESGLFDVQAYDAEKVLTEEEQKVFDAQAQAWTNKDKEGIEYIQSITNKSLKSWSKRAANEIIYRSSQRELEIHDIAERIGITIDDTNRSFIYQQRAKELIKQFNIVGEPSVTLKNHFDRLANSKNLDSQLSKRNEMVADDFRESVHTFAINKDLESGQNAVTNATRKFEIKNGAVVPVHGDPKAAWDETARKVAATNRFVTFDDFKTHMLDICQLGTSGEGCPTFGDRFDKHGGATETLDKIWKDRAASLKELQANEKATNNALNLNEADVFLGPEGPEGTGGIDIKKNNITLDNYDALVKKFNSMEAGPGKDKIGSYLYLKPGTTSMSATKDLIWQGFLSEDHQLAASQYMKLSETERNSAEGKRISKRIKNQEALVEQYGEGFAKEIKNIANTELTSTAKIKGISALDSSTSASAKRMNQKIVEHFYLEYNTLMGDESIRKNPSTAISAAWATVVKSLRSEEGFYATQDVKVGGNTQKEFVLTSTEPFNRIESGKDFYKVLEAVQYGGEVGDTIYKGRGTLWNKEEGLNQDIVNSIADSEVRETASDILSGIEKGLNVDIPRNVHLLHKVINDPEVTIDVLMNDLFNKKGYTSIRMVPNHHTWLKTKVDLLWNPDDPSPAGWRLSGEKVRVSDKDVINYNIFADIVNQTGRMPIGNQFVEKDPIVDLANDNPGLDFSSAYWENDVLRGVPFGTDYMDLIENRVQYGLDLDYDANGGIVFKRKKPQPPEPNFADWITGQQSPEDYHAGMEAIRKRNRESK